jgi:hypothetical protein
MTQPPRRQRRETAEAPCGIGGLSPHPARGPVTALRVLGRGFEITVDANGAERFRGNVGDRFMVKGMTVLALDEPTHQLVQPLTVYCGIGAHKDVDSALAAILWKRPIIMSGSRSKDVLELARAIHEHSIRRGFPFLQVNTVPTNDAAIEALCRDAGCGTLFLDLTKRVELPRTLVRNLFSDHFHLWTIAVAPAAEEACRCFGPGTDFIPFCTLGFRRTSEHTSTFTQN